MFDAEFSTFLISCSATQTSKHLVNISQSLFIFCSMPTSGFLASLFPWTVKSWHLLLIQTIWKPMGQNFYSEVNSRQGSQNWIVYFLQLEGHGKRKQTNTILPDCWVGLVIKALVAKVDDLRTDPRSQCKRKELTPATITFLIIITYTQRKKEKKPSPICCYLKLSHKLKLSQIYIWSIIWGD